MSQRSRASRRNPNGDNFITSRILPVLESLPDEVDRLHRLAWSRGGLATTSGEVVDRQVARIDAQLKDVLDNIHSNIQDGRMAMVVVGSLLIRTEAVCTALLPLLASAVRVELLGQADAATRQPTAPAAQRATQRLNRSAWLSERLWLATGLRACKLVYFSVRSACLAASAEGRTLVRKLIAAQTLQASARQLAAAAELLDQRPQPGEPEREVSLAALQIANVIIQCLLEYSGTFRAAEMEVAAAVRSSHIREHAARLLMRLRGMTGSGISGVTETFLSGYVDLSGGRFGRLLPPTPEQQLLAQAASGPCADFAAMAFGLAALCAADGGSWYGLPQEVREHAASIMAKTAEQGHGTRAETSDALHSPVAALASAVVNGCQSRRVHRRTAVTVLMRVARLALASNGLLGAAAAGSGAGGSGADASAAGGSGDGPPRSGIPGSRQPPRSGDGGGAVAGGRQYQPNSLDMVRQKALGFDLPARCLEGMREVLAGRPAAWADVAEEWWRLAVALYRAPKCDPVFVKHLETSLLAVAVQLPQDGSLAPVPPPDLSVALDAGLLPALERLLRQAAQCPKGSEAMMLDGLRSFLLKHRGASGTQRRFITPLLAHGDPRQAAALVATCGKVLRHDAQGKQLTPLVCLFLLEATSVLGAAVKPGGPPEPAPEPALAPAPASALPPQLWRMLGCILREWLPVLYPFKSPGYRKAALVDDSYFAVAQLAPWAGVLAGVAWAERESEATTERVNGAAAAEGTGSGAGAGGGSQLSGSGLLDGVSLIRSLLVWCAESMPLEVTEALLGLAAACPDGLRAAFQQASEGVPGSSTSGGKNPEVWLPWSPRAIRGMVPALRRQGARGEALAPGLEALARLVGLWVSEEDRDGSREGGGEGSAAAAADEALRVVRSSVAGRMEELASVGRLLGPPVAASSLLGVPTCAYPGCVSLKGDSELGVRLQRCGRCGAVGYCCRECQAAHWRAGHKEACRPPGASNGDGGGGETQPAGQQL